MNKERAKQISNKIKEALSLIDEQENIKISIDGVSFTSTSINLRISGTDNLNPVEFNRTMTLMSKRYGFTQNIIGMEFTCSNGDFVIDSFAPKNRKYPILATRKIDGAKFKFPPKNILKYLGGDSIINRNANLKNLLD